MAPTLYNWNVVDICGLYHLRGRVLHDPRFEDNTAIQTTPIREINFVDGFAVTDNSEYILI